MQTLFTITLIVEIIFTFGFIAAPSILLCAFGVIPNTFSITLGYGSSVN